MRNLQQYLSMEDFSDQPVDPVEPAAEPALDAEVAQDLTEAEVVVPEVAEEPVTEEVLEAAEEEAVDAEVAAEEDHVAYEGAVSAADEVEDLTATVEHYASVLAHGLKTGTFSNQTCANAQYQLERLEGVFGKGSVPTPSLESYGNDDLKSYYTVSLESFRGFMNRLTDVSFRIDKATTGYFMKGSLVKGYKARAEAITKNADAQLQKLSALKGNEKVSVPVSDRRLAGASGDLFAAVNADLKATTAAVTKGLGANETFLKQVGDVLVEATNEGGVGKTGAIVAKAGSIKPAADAYPAEAFNGLLGGRKLTRGTEDAGEGTRGALKALRKNAIPGVEAKKGEKGSGEGSFGRADASRVLQLAKTYAALAAKAADQTGEHALDQLDKVKGKVARTYGNSVFGDNNKARAETTSWSEGKDLDALATALPRLLQSHIGVYRFLNEHALSVAAGLEALGQKILSKLESAEKSAAAAE